MPETETLVLRTLISFAVFVFPALKLCIRVGLPQASVLLMLIPFLGLPLFLWVVACFPWRSVNSRLEGMDA